MFISSYWVCRSFSFLFSSSRFPEFPKLSILKIGRGRRGSWERKTDKRRNRVRRRESICMCDSRAGNTFSLFLNQAKHNKNPCFMKGIQRFRVWGFQGVKFSMKWHLGKCISWSLAHKWGSDSMSLSTCPHPIPIFPSVLLRLELGVSQLSLALGFYSKKA